jgi:peptide/nickel transport system substrate-binding protein
LVFRFYVNEQDLLEAFNEGAVESISGISPEKALELDEVDARVLTSPLPRDFAVFFNQTQAPVLANFEVRRALDISSPKEEIVENILGGFATVIDGPIPAGIYPWSGEREVTKSLDERVAEAQEILAEDGWTPNPDTGILEKKSGTDTITLSFSISTSDVPELRAVGEYLVSTWSRLGADIELVVFEPGDLNQNVIRPRNFDSLLFGEVVGRDADIYPFWHSSQKSDPGLNVAMYDNDEVDKLLDDARSATDKAASESYYKTFSDTVKADIPAVFLYTPSFLYILPQKLESVDIGSLAVSQDRFLSIRDWYIEKDRIWKPFAK